MATLKERIQSRLDELGINAFEAARRGGLERSYLHDILTGRKTSVREANIVKLSKALNVDPIFFLLNDEVEPVDLDEDHRSANRSSHQVFHGSRLGAIPELDGQAGAGEGTTGDIVVLESKGIEYGHAVKAEWVFPPEFIRNYLGADPRYVWIIEVKGHSMLPTLEPGAKVFIDTKDQKPDEQSVYLINDDGPKVKRLMRIRGSDPAAFRILSDNALVPEDQILESELNVIGRVCGQIRRM